MKTIGKAAANPAALRRPPLLVSRFNVTSSQSIIRPNHITGWPMARSTRSAGHVLPAPGTQSLLPQVAMLVPPGRAAVLRTTYAENQRAASLAGHRVTEVSSVDQLGHADLAIVVNPNNPDGRLVERTI